MDLGDRASSSAVSSQTLIIKPENQANITKSNGSRNIKVFIPPHIGYWLPSQSDFHFNIKMAGRGQPIPSKDCGCHSLFLNVRTWDGTGTHLLESVEQYNTYVAQCYNYNKTQALSNDRAEFQGLQANRSLDNNLFWALAGGTNWAGGTIKAPNVARQVQFVSPLKTKLYDTSEYVPVECLGGVRLELQLDNYLRSLEYTTGSLGVGAVNGLPTYPLGICPSLGEYDAIVGPPAQNTLTQFILAPGGTGTIPGSNYVAGHVYAYGIGTLPVVGDGSLAGYIRVVAATAGVPTQLEIYALGEIGVAGSRSIPVAYELLYLDVPSAGGSVGLRCQVHPGLNCIGAGRVTNRHQNIHVPLWSGNGDSLVIQATSYVGASTISPPGIADDFGSNPVGSVQKPRRDVSKRASAAYNALGCFPTTVMPFSVGDRIYMNHNHDPGAAVTDVTEVGCLVEIQEYVPLNIAGSAPAPTGMPTLIIRPTVAALQDAVIAPGGVVAPAYVAGSQVFGPPVPPGPTDYDGRYAYTHLANGEQVYVDSLDRVNGWIPGGFVAGDGGDNPSLILAAAEVVDFTISDFQYQVKQVIMPDNIAMAEMAQTKSGAGLQIDLETIQTRQVNLAAIQGPTSQLISLPNIQRGLGVLSVPLNQNQQRGLEHSSLRGHANGASDYQWELGIKGLCPNRPVPVEKASLDNPLVQSQEVNEKMKTMDSFGVSVSNLDRVGANWSVGRSFARPGQYFNLVAAGDLLLKIQYNVGQTFPKLFVHFINHLRSINISSNGIQIMN